MKAITLFSVFVALAGCTSPNPGPQPPQAPDSETSDAIAQDLDKYSSKVVTATDGNIADPTAAQKTGDKPMLSYVIKFRTSDAALMAREEGDTNKLSYALNGALQEAWTRRFCTAELKSIMAKHNVFLVSGHLNDADGELQVFTSCMR